MFQLLQRQAAALVFVPEHFTQGLHRREREALVRVPLGIGFLGGVILPPTRVMNGTEVGDFPLLVALTPFGFGHEEASTSLSVAMQRSF